MNAQRLLERFLRYVRIDTTAGDSTEVYPSSPGQLELGRLLRDELLAIGLTDAQQDEHGIVLATLPATISADVPTIAWFAHVDTSPETTGKNVNPQVHRQYDGRDLALGSSKLTLRVADNPELKQLVGKTIITTDGATLLGADDKAGVAVIMEAVEWLMEHPEIEHGPIRICFTCDEEIGHGVDHVDVGQLAAVAGYTLDGAGADEIDMETFSGDLARVTVRGVNIHPSIGKGRMVNAVRVASDFIDRLPKETLSPETTEGREGFLHPYQIEGGVAQVVIKIILRDFDTPRLAEMAELLRDTARQVAADHPGAAIDVSVDRQYRNIADGLSLEPRAVLFAERALERLGRTPRRTIVRGGTDGSLLSEKGLPTPNLSTGEHNPHSPLEWTCLEEMVAAAEGLVSLAEVWTTDL